MVIDNAWSLWVQVAILLGVIVNMLYSVLKRKWESEDINRRAKDVEREVSRKAEEIKEALAVRNARLEADLKIVQIEVRHREDMAAQRDETAAAHRAMLALKLAENTDATKEVGAQAQVAYTEANAANAKIAEVNQRAVIERQQDQRTAEHIKATTDNMHDMAQQFIVQQGPGGPRPDPAEPEPPAAEREKADPLRGPHQDQPT